MAHDMPLKYIKGVGEKRAELLSKLGIHSLYELVHFYPRAYLDMTDITPIGNIIPDTVCCFKATLGYEMTEHKIRNGLTLYKTVLFDDTGTVHLTLFNNKYLAATLHEGEEYIFYGKVTYSKRGFEMTSPTIEKADGKAMLKPVYPLTAGLTNNILCKIITNALKVYCESGERDVIPESIRQNHNLCHSAFALKNIHFPGSKKDLEIARRRLIFEELLTLQLGIRLIKGRNTDKTKFKANPEYVKEFFSLLPFTLTNAQKRVIDECLSDMTKGVPMNRLVQGDVGSGKTVVAAAVIYTMARDNIQSAFMAPTEILAAQHYKTLSALMEGSGIKTELLTGSLTSKQKKEVKERLKSGETHLVIGTHAILSEDVEFCNLGLIITDEQHRFGVNQRGILSRKGNYPHTLVMSATPIPRTLSLIIYGDLDLSVIDELPKGRQKISTYCVDTSYRERIYSFIKKHLDMSLQAYIVCPLVEESDSGLTAATEYAKSLAENQFKNYKVGLLHGKMKGKEKDAIMKAFAEGELQLLVSTTVIEVGVDVPNSVIMVIENAERFGLSALHQLRGRVGRGKNKSYCVLVSDAKGETAKTRLDIMCKTNDGFVIADKDLQLRGPGDFFGSRQHGLPELKIACIADNMDIVMETKRACETLLLNDPKLEKTENEGLFVSVRKLFTAKEYLALN